MNEQKQNQHYGNQKKFVLEKLLPFDKNAMFF